MKRPFVWIRDTEAWIGRFGIFFGTLWGVELPNGQFIGWKV